MKQEGSEVKGVCFRFCGCFRRFYCKRLETVFEVGRKLKIFRNKFKQDKRVWARAFLKTCSRKINERKKCKEGLKLINGKINAKSGLLCFPFKLSQSPGKISNLTFSSGSILLNQSYLCVGKINFKDPFVTFELS